MATRSHERARSIVYWTVAVAFTIFGFLDLIAIGAPFFLTGIAMLAVGRWRRDPAVLWPALVGAWAFVLGYLLVGPLGCTSSGGAPALRVPSVAAASLGHTACTNVLGIDYSGSGAYRPPLLPGLFAGLAATGIGAFVTRLIARRHRAARV